MKVGLAETLPEILCEELAHILMERNLSLGTAESCTGGLLSACFTSINGASSWFKGAIVSYDNSVKMGLLNVEEKILLEYGAVSEECVLQMAQGACKALDCNLSISISGIAGPSGGSIDKPVGTIWMGFCLRCGQDTQMYAQKFFFKGTREEIRKCCVFSAVQTCLNFLKKN